MDEEERNIYDVVLVVVDPDDTMFKVINFCGMNTIASKIKDKDTALAIRKAYCDGFYDGQRLKL